MRTMTQTMGLEDLQSPLLQAEVRRIKGERSRLLQQLDPIKQLALETAATTQRLEVRSNEHSPAMDISCQEAMLNWYKNGGFID